MGFYVDAHQLQKQRPRFLAWSAGSGALACLEGSYPIWSSQALRLDGWPSSHAANAASATTCTLMLSPSPCTSTFVSAMLLKSRRLVLTLPMGLPRRQAARRGPRLEGTHRHPCAARALHTIRQFISLSQGHCPCVASDVAVNPKGPVPKSTHVPRSEIGIRSNPFRCGPRTASSVAESPECPQGLCNAHEYTDI